MTKTSLSLPLFSDSAVGPDGVRYRLLAGLPEGSLSMLLTVLGSIWESGIFRPFWRAATIVAVLGPGRDSSDPCGF